MRRAGDILLVACYELGHQPLSVAWPAAFLERAGYAPAVMDLSVEPFDGEKVTRAQVIAIAVPMHTALRLGVLVARRIRTLNPTAHLCFYGLYAALNAAELLEGCADTVLAGEVEERLVDLVQRLETGEPGGRPVAGEATELVKLSFPVPARHALPAIKKYAHVEREGRRELTAYVEASRGCKHHCRHCPIPAVYDGRFFVVAVETVLADVRQQVAAGASHVTFGDPDFLNGPRHALAVARALHAEFPTLTFDFTAKVEHLLRERTHLEELAALGCVFIVTAAESLDDRVLGYLDKGHTRADLVAVLGAARAAGIALRPTWVAFTPWTTLEGYRQWLDFLAEEALVDHVDPVQYGIRLLVPPGSLLLELPEMRQHLGELVPGGFHYRWTHPDPRVERLAEEVAGVVAAAAERNEDAALTFDRVRSLAATAAGVPAPPALDLPARRARPPRLTEPWFC
jgi:radical SAM superfamily enzyme YgiQ (UPF0313 family)